MRKPLDFISYNVAVSSEAAIDRNTYVILDALFQTRVYVTGIIFPLDIQRPSQTRSHIRPAASRLLANDSARSGYYDITATIECAPLWTWRNAEEGG